VPIYSALKTRAPWRVNMSDDPDPEFSAQLIVRTEQEGNTTHHRWDDVIEDVFEVRRRVFNIRTPKDVRQLIEDWGPWQIEKTSTVAGIPIRFSAVMRRCDFYRNALLDRSVEDLSRVYEGDEVAEGVENFYLWQALPMELVFRDPPTARAICMDIEDSLRASVFLDRLDGFTWRRCRREDCGQIFELKNKREKLYCGNKCAHLQSVRDSNERKKAAQKPAKRVAKKGKRVNR
jgi:hypothetical protein